MTETIVRPDDYRTTPTRLALAGAVAVVAAIVADVVIYSVARVTGAVPDDLPADAESVGIPAIIAACVLTISVATLAMGLFARLSQHPVRNFTILAAIVAATSLQAPLGIADAPAGLVVSLLLMHGATAAIAWWCLTRLSRIA